MGKNKNDKEKENINFTREIIFSISIFLSTLLSLINFKYSQPINPIYFLLLINIIAIIYISPNIKNTINKYKNKEKQKFTSFIILTTFKYGYAFLYMYIFCSSIYLVSKHINIKLNLNTLIHVFLLFTLLLILLVVWLITGTIIYNNLEEKTEKLF